MPELTQEKIDKYVKDGGGYCPYCGHGQIEGGSFDMEGGAVYQKVWCLECEKEWVDCYHLGNILE